MTAVVIERMDRLQAVLATFDMEHEVDANMDEEQCQWCLEQWEAIRPMLLDKTADKAGAAQASGEKQSEEAEAEYAGASSSVMEIEDSQDIIANGTRVPMARLADATARPLTELEAAELAAHEEDEREAAEAEQRADELRWQQYRAAILRESEDAVMREAMNFSTGPPGKRFRIHVQVEAEDGRVVRQETFPMVVQEGESVQSYHDDPETSALREAAREARAEIVEEVEPPSQPQRVLDESEMEWFMGSELGRGTFDQWIITDGVVVCAGRGECQA